MAGGECEYCGTELREDSKFCHQCGSRVDATDDIAEYQQVTVLFADVVRSMDIAATLDVERLREVMTELVERSAAAVKRYGGGTVEYTGDGIMALFGAPVALEDHAFRACLAALAIQEEAIRLAAEVHQHDGVTLRLRVGVNSGQVIAGGLGDSGSLGYTAVGEPIGFAQRMESVAPPGGVMLSESTARLVENSVQLAEPEYVRIKGADEPVFARKLIAIGTRNTHLVHDAALVGRDWEMGVISAIVSQTVEGRGGVVNVMGPAGIGKSRAAREAAALAGARGVEVHWAFCESHARDVPFYVVTRLLRADCGVADLDADAARAHVRNGGYAEADPQDLLLLDELLGIADPEVATPLIDPDARRRRLTALLNSVWLARTEPTLFVIEDAHWIDSVSESMLTDLLTVVSRSPLMVLVTSRPEYDGALKRTRDSQAIALAALSDSDATTLLGELLGSDPTVGDLSAVITARAAGNPFFAEEMVREFGQRGVLVGERGRYVCRTDVAELRVPATVQAAIKARIDRLSAAAKRALYAASVIGARFRADLLSGLDIDPQFDELLKTELIDQVRFTPDAEFAFRHPLIRAVAYESQLKSDRAQWHRRLATTIQERAPESVEENAALIAEHLEAAGELPTAFGWHMRSAAWATNRDLDAARLSWERAVRIADSLPDDPSLLPMRIAPRTMLCATDFHANAIQQSQLRFAELRDLCNVAGDKVSLAIAMTGPATELVYTGQSREGARLASEQMTLLESIGEASLTMTLAVIAFVNWADAGDYSEILRWSQHVVDLADGDPTKGAGFGVGSPLAYALACRGVARWWLGRAGWREDLGDAIAMARDSDPVTLAFVVSWTFGVEIVYGVLQADDSAVREIEEAVQITRRAADNHALGLAEYALGAALLSRDNAADRRRGLELIEHVRESQREHAPFLVPVAELLIAAEKARCDDRDAAVGVMRKAVNELHEAGRLGFGVYGTGVLVETLLHRGTESDVSEALRAIDRLASLRADQESAIREITLVRLRALLAEARGDTMAYRDLANRYRTMAESLGYEGHTAWAAAMGESGSALN